jgi:hypothetical protein
LLDNAAEAGVHPQALRAVVQRRLETRDAAEKRQQRLDKLDEYPQALEMHSGEPPRQAVMPRQATA